jgi:hypothetical protein
MNLNFNLKSNIFPIKNCNNKFTNFNLNGNGNGNDNYSAAWVGGMTSNINISRIGNGNGKGTENSIGKSNIIINHNENFTNYFSPNNYGQKSQNLLYEEIIITESSNENGSSCTDSADFSHRKIRKEKIEEKKNFLKKKISESFEYIRKEIQNDTNSFLNKFIYLNEKIHNINSTTSELKNFKGQKIVGNKLNFLLEIFDIYGINHYFTSMSIEMINYYHNTLKKLFLRFIKLLNHSIITISSLENNIINTHENLKKDFEFIYEIKLPKISYYSYFNQKLKSQKFFHSLFFRVFAVKNLKYKPIFAYYNFTNLIGFLFSNIFFIKALRRIFKYSPNHKKIIKYLLYSLCSIFVTYLVSFVLNKFYNRKSERKFLKLSEKINFNLKYIINKMENMEKELNDYENKYVDCGVKMLDKITESINILK